jgi:hypothetical protein
MWFGEENRSIDELNEYVVEYAKKICWRMNEARKRYDKEIGIHITDMLPPYNCDIRETLAQNLRHALVSYNNTIMAAYFSEYMHVKMSRQLEEYKARVKYEERLIMEFMNENGLEKKFKEYAERRMKQKKFAS